jgi:hypothetical protein
MDKFTLQGDELRSQYSEKVNLGQVFADIERQLEDNNRVVCQYIVNGLILTELDEKRFSQYALSEVVTLEYFCQTTETILGEVVSGWLATLPSLQEKVEIWSEKLKAGLHQGSTRDLYQLVENCELLTASMHTASELMGADYSLQFTELKQLDGETKSCLREAVRYLRGQDFVQLALVLEYDLNNSLEKWQALLRGLINADCKHQMDRQGVSH